MKLILNAVIALVLTNTLFAQPFEEIKAHASPAVYAGWSMDGTRLFTASDAGTAVFYDKNSIMANGIIHGEPLTGASFSRSGLFAATVSVKGNVKLWDASTGALIKTFQNTYAPVNACAFSADGSLIAAAGREVYLWDTKKFGRHKTIKPESESRAAAFSGNGAYFAFTSGRMIYLWKLSSNSMLSTVTGAPSPDLKGLKLLNHYLIINALSFSADSQLIAAAGDSGVVSCFRAEDGYRIWRSPASEENMNAVVFTASGGHVLSAGSRGIIYIHNPADGKVTGTIGPLPASVTGLDFQPKTAVLTAACANGSVYRINTSFKKPLPPLSSFLKTAGLIFAGLALIALILYVISAVKGKSVKDWRV